MRPALPVAVAALVLAASFPLGAGKAKVYRYETRDGKVDYGTEVPEGAVVLGEVGEVAVDAATPAVTVDPAAASAAARTAAARARTHFEGALAAVADRPVVAGCVGAAVFLWAVVLLRIFSAAFRTRELDWNGAVRLVGLIGCGVAALAALGQGLEWIWSRIGWSPRSELEPAALDTVALVLYAGVAVLAFRQRLGVGTAQAALLASLWFALVAGAAIIVWVYLAAAGAVAQA